jgi:hypothetical protein
VGGLSATCGVTDGGATNVAARARRRRGAAHSDPLYAQRCGASSAGAILRHMDTEAQTPLLIETLAAPLQESEAQSAPTMSVTRLPDGQTNKDD